MFNREIKYFIGPYCSKRISDIKLYWTKALQVSVDVIEVVIMMQLVLVVLLDKKPTKQIPNIENEGTEGFALINKRNYVC